MSAGDAMLEAKGLAKAFGAVQATSGLDLDLRVGEVHALIGPNGAGKTTAIGQLAGDIRPDAGTIRFDGRDVTRLAMPARARAGIVRSYQISSLFENLGARANVELAIRGRRGWARLLTDSDAEPVRAEAERHLEAARAGSLADSLVSELAHGEKRQIEIAMVTAAGPKVVLLDEPMAGLGGPETAAISSLIAELARERAVLLVEHDMDVVFALAHRVTVLVAGRVIASGSPNEIRTDREVQRAYLSEDV